MAREMISTWSPYSTETDQSELLTEPYIPTPGPPPVPVLLSNFPLSSVAQEVNLNTPNMDISPFQPATRGLAIQQPSWPATPPQPDEPRQILRARVRPSFGRTATGYEFPAQNLETIAAVGPRPSLRRAISTPQLSEVLPVPIPIAAPSSSPERSISQINRPTGSFPLARSQPIGLSRLRESAGPIRPAILPEIRRPSFVAERRISIVEHGSRRASGSRKPSITLSPAKSDRKLSVDSRSGSIARKLSATPSDLRKVSLDPSLRCSTASRGSSVVSLGEYGYLGTEITPESKTEEFTKTPMPPVTLRERRNAPPAIVLPPYQFPAKSLHSPGTATPRYNPLDSFFGRPTPALSDSSPQSIDPLSPSSDLLRSPFTPGGVLDRGRPVTSPEFAYSFPKRSIEVRTSPELVGKTAARSPSYKFPILADGGLLPQALAAEEIRGPGPRVTFDQLPLKSILVHRTSDSLVTSTPLPPTQAPISDIHLSEDIQAHLRSKRESRIEQQGAESHSPKKPPMARQSSFTRLFQRAKAQASPSSPHSLAK